MAIKKNRSFRSRIFISFLLVFCLFSFAILLFQYEREKENKAVLLENTLDNITVVTHNFIEQNHLYENANFKALDSLLLLLPNHNQRITIVSNNGNVLYDNFAKDITTMDNHLSRPEVQKALYQGKGSNIRKSATTNQKFYYYAKSYKGYFIRTALVYGIEVQHFLQASRVFFIFVVILFLLMWLIIELITRRLGNFISQLENFSIKAAMGEEVGNEMNFTDNELNNISQQIKTIYNRLNKAKTDLTQEKEKLFQHLNVLQEGIAFFSADNQKLLSNSHFIHYINIISDKSSISAPDILEIPEMKPVVDFIVRSKNSQTISATELPWASFTVSKGEYIFEIKAILFADKSFEIMIGDISRLEKRRLIKQQLTANIAHELKTPVASMKGYLETMKDIKNMPEEKRNYFIGRAYFQAERLSALLNDISLLNNIEEAGDLFEFKEVTVLRIINDTIENQGARLNEKAITCNVVVAPQIKVFGNEHLLTSIFQNLIENTIKYGGEGLTITIKNYHSDQKFHYFTYSDNGSGIPEEHLPRIFERFYRVDEGRSREKGGTGLGLSIVKNAVQLHKGEISVKNRAEGGVEFLFSLAKA